MRVHQHSAIRMSKSTERKFVAYIVATENLGGERG